MLNYPDLKQTLQWPKSMAILMSTESNFLTKYTISKLLITREKTSSDVIFYKYKMQKKIKAKYSQVMITLYMCMHSLLTKKKCY